MSSIYLTHTTFQPHEPPAERREMAVKHIPIEAVTIGMYVVRLDRPWPEASQLKNKHRIENVEDIARLRSHGVCAVTIDPTLGADVTDEVQAETSQDLDPLSRKLAHAREVRAEAMAMLQGVFEGVKTGTPINSVEVKRAVHTVMDEILQRHDALLGLIHLQHGDANMFAHAVNVSAYALVVGKMQGFDKPQLERLGVGAMLHDVGELRLPRNLLRKREVYSEQERRLIQQHPRLGVAMLSQADGIHEESRRIVLEHHERPDGSGYPQGVKGLHIAPMSEIVGIVDMYDAMISDREGRPPLAPAQAIKEIYQSGLHGHIDRGWAERIIRCLGIYPVGSLVELSTGERALVVAANPLDALRPTVRIVGDASQQPCAHPLTVELATVRPLEPERTIVRALDPTKERLSIEAYIDEAAGVS